VTKRGDVEAFKAFGALGQTRSIFRSR
jgi:hypothetical protein